MATRARVRVHGRRFYNFEGLDQFKAKFQPERWDPVFAIVNEPGFSPLIIYAIAAAFTAGAPLNAMSQALVRAMKLEINGVKKKMLQATDRGAQAS